MGGADQQSELHGGVNTVGSAVSTCEQETECAPDSLSVPSGDAMFYQLTWSVRPCKEGTEFRPRGAHRNTQSTRVE